MVTKTLTTAGLEKDNKIIVKIVANHDNNINFSPLCSRQVEWEESSSTCFIIYRSEHNTILTERLLIFPRIIQLAPLWLWRGYNPSQQTKQENNRSNILITFHSELPGDFIWEHSYHNIFGKSAYNFKIYKELL